MPIDPRLMEILACPACKSPVFESESSIFCTNEACRRRFDVADGIPVMLIDESAVLDRAEWERAMAKRPAEPK
ncbi:Trm112 family protein [Candidatus Sumerlaeota bacterium]|nr:Trm112 family protein [Candidatus Sumerlaeota bacterium]